jgi:hypothetical protein
MRFLGGRRASRGFRRIAPWLAVPLAAFIAASCGGDSDSDGSGGGSGTGGSSGSAGTASGGAAGSGGGVTGGSGGATGGSAGMAGSDSGVVPPCDPPTVATDAALCLQLAPDNVKWIPGDAAFDGKGVLGIAIYDTPFPNSTDGGSATPLAFRIEPPQPDGGTLEKTLAELVQTPYRFDGLPSTVYVVAWFFDDATAIGKMKDPDAGTWVGGYDLSNGLVENPPIDSVALTIGAGQNASLPIHPLRKLSVTVTRTTGVNPAGDGQGPLGVIVTQTQTLTSTTKLFGFGSLPCADLSGTSSITVDGILYGSGPFYVTGVLDDFGLGTKDLPPGSLASLALSGGNLQIPAKNKITVPVGDYQVTSSIELGWVTPAPDAGADNANCSTIPDAGSD